MDRRLVAAGAGRYRQPAHDGRWQGFRYDLQLRSERPLVLHGQQGYSEKSGKGQALLLQPAVLPGARRVERDGLCIAVTGQAWLDREWSSQPLAAGQTGWDWFSLHLDSGAKLMLFQVREARGGVSRRDLDRPAGPGVALLPAQIRLQPLAWAPQGNGAAADPLAGAGA